MTMISRFLSLLLALVAPCLWAGAARAADARLTVVGERFVLAMPNGHRLTSPDLVGAELTTQDGQTIRIDAVTPSKERPDILLHTFSIRDASGAWRPGCDADAYGRRAGFPVAGRWDAQGRYHKDAAAWFLTCSSGSQGKCVLWGYDPWTPGPGGADLARFYQACQNTVRANYDGRGAAHTKNGTSIDVADILGIETWDSRSDARYAFEAGWGPDGAVCVERTRWPELLSREALLATAPQLGGLCNRATARRRGALLFTRVMLKPVLSAHPKINPGQGD